MNGQERLGYLPGNLGEENMSATRNSMARKLVDAPVKLVATNLHKRFPNVTANQVTAAGILGVGLGSMLSVGETSPMTKKVAVGVLGFSSALDGLDGALARVIKTEDPSRANPYGNLVDAAADRIQEATLGMSRMISSQKRADKSGEVLALVSVISNGAPSLMRAIAESRGIAVSESGGNPLGFLGTRTGRTITGILSTVYPEVKGVSIQKILDTLNIAANTFTTVSRFRKAFISRKIEKSLKPQAIEEAEERAIVLSGTFAATAMTAGATYILGSK